jgi:hypothetical protein
MTRSVPAPWRLHPLSVIFAAVPFAFALIRAVRTGYDYRYFWVAFASLIGAAGIVAISRGSRRSLPIAFALSAAAFVSSTLLAMVAAMLLGTRMGPGMLVVAASFGICFATGVLVHAGTRQA